MSEMAPEGAVESGDAVEAAAEPAWSGPSQEEWEAQQQALGSMSAWVQQRMHAEQQSAQQGQQPLQFDPWSDDPTEQLNALIEARVNARLAPLEQTYQRISEAEGQELAYDVIADNVSREGDFLHEGSKDLAFQLARGFLNAAVQRYGYGDRAAEAAIEQACQHVRQLEQTIGESYYNRQTNQLATLAGARREPGSSGPAAQVPSGTFKRGESIADRYFGG